MPPIELRAGQVWEKDGKRMLYTRFVRIVTAYEVIYQDGSMQVCAATPKQFRRWAKTARLVEGR